MNADWHAHHKLCRNASLEQRVEWHLQHARACACRELPPTVLAELRRREREPRPRVVAEAAGVPGGPAPDAP